MRKIVLGISGGSAFELSLDFIEYLPQDIFLFIVPSRNAHKVYKIEKNKNLKEEIFLRRNKNIEIHEEISSPLASGSFSFESCIILPTSSNTLAQISNGIQNNLLTRVAGVCIKEKRNLIIALREMPFDSITLKNMLSLSNAGVIISPPIVGYYADINNLKDMQKFLIGKYYDMLKIHHNLYKRWQFV